MAEMIQTIQEVKDVDEMDGYQITTNQHKYCVLISSWQKLL